MVKLEALKDGKGNIIISEDSFEHLLNCLDSQKFNPASPEQDIIDEYNHECRNILHQRYIFQTTDDGLFLYKKYLFQDKPSPWISNDMHKIHEIFKDTRLKPTEENTSIYNIQPSEQCWLIERPMRYDDIYLCISEDGVNYRKWKDEEIEKISSALSGYEYSKNNYYIQKSWNEQLSKMNTNFIENFLRKLKIEKL